MRYSRDKGFRLTPIKPMKSFGVILFILIFPYFFLNVEVYFQISFSALLITAIVVAVSLGFDVIDYAYKSRCHYIPIGTLLISIIILTIAVKDDVYLSKIDCENKVITKYTTTKPNNVSNDKAPVDTFYEVSCSNHDNYYIDDLNDDDWKYKKLIFKIEEEVVDGGEYE